MLIFMVTLADGNRRLIGATSWIAAAAIAVGQFDSFSALTLIGPLDAMVGDDEDSPSTTVQ
ncbi:MAG: hypothetical protein ACYCSH_16410 [Acidithiobacillus sp.]